jgi:DNA-binding NarL/FixJ family response regulator
MRGLQALAADAPISVLLVDDHEVVRSALRGLLDQADDITVVGEASGEQEALAEANRLTPDVAVMDVMLAQGNGISATAEILASGLPTRVVVLTSATDEETLLDGIRAGASCFVSKHRSSAELVDAIRLAADGQSLIDPGLSRLLLDRLTVEPRNDPWEAFTPREVEVLACIADGKTNREIAQLLHFSERTVKTIVSSTLSKLGVKRRSEAAVHFVQARGGQPSAPADPPA